MRGAERQGGAGGTIANVGVHGHKVDLHMERLWDRNIAITTRLVDTVTIPQLMKAVAGGKVAASSLVTHRFPLAQMEQAYLTFGHAADSRALKVIIKVGE